ncbi:sodium-independent anion transporter, partial [Pseudomonas syringae pv. tagetis]
ATHDLAKGVLTGVVLSAVFFTRKVGKMLSIDDTQVDIDSRVYVVRGQVFFASAGQFVSSFNYLDVPKNVKIDPKDAHFW